MSAAKTSAVSCRTVTRETGKALYASATDARQSESRQTHRATCPAVSVRSSSLCCSCCCQWPREKPYRHVLLPVASPLAPPSSPMLSLRRHQRQYCCCSCLAVAEYDWKTEEHVCYRRADDDAGTFQWLIVHAATCDIDEIIKLYQCADTTTSTVIWFPAVECKSDSAKLCSNRKQPYCRTGCLKHNTMLPGTRGQH